MRIVSIEEYLADPPPLGGRIRPDGRVDVYESVSELPPSPPPPLPPITPRQLRLALAGAGKLTQVDVAIDAMPEPARTQARIHWEYSVEYERHHPLVASLGAAIGLNDAQIDALWQQALEL